MSEGDIHSIIDQSITSHESALFGLSQDIWNNPEIRGKEENAHNVLTTFLKSHGFAVDKEYVLKTAFKAVFQQGDGGAHVALLCEYDALEELGHAAGHNLTSEGCVAAALALKAYLQHKKLDGRISVFGCPSEAHGGGGKIDLLKAKAFEGVDFALSFNPMNTNIVCPPYYAIVFIKVQYTGKAAHASSHPWEGRNALDAAIACYNNIALLKQQFKPYWCVSGVIKEGGRAANIIPQHAELEFWLRAPDHKDLVTVEQKCAACFVAAAKATGTECTFDIAEKIYNPMLHNEKLAEIFQEEAEALGINFLDFQDVTATHGGSTDMGNVSQELPCLRPAYDIGTPSFVHTEAFHDAAGTDTAHKNTLRVAKALAATAVKVMAKSALLAAVVGTFQSQNADSN